MSEAFVRDQYEAYPYPPRDPAEEPLRLLTGSPSQLAEVVHYVFGGRPPAHRPAPRPGGPTTGGPCAGERPFRALVAGGGTGDGTIMLAQQLADWDAARGVADGDRSEVVYLDLSAAARAIAAARAAARGLANVRFVQTSLLDLAASGLGPFDYIDCCGVLHHLDDPLAGLSALVAVLADDGGLGLMLYGTIGRSGVYEMQEMLRMIAPAERDPAPVRLNLTRRLMAGLPEGNLLRRNPFVADHLTGEDAHLFDLFLHSRDRAFRVPEILELLAGAGLRLVSFVPPALYDPATMITDPALTARLDRLDGARRAAFAELLAGSLRKHIFYAVKAANPVALPDPRDPACVPVLLDFDASPITGDVQPGLGMSATVEGVVVKRPLPALAAAMLRRADGRRTLAEIHAEIAQEVRPVPFAQFARQFAEVFQVMNGLGKMVLRISG